MQVIAQFDINSGPIIGANKCIGTIIDIFNKTVLEMKQALLLFLLLLTAYSHIYSVPPKVTYNYDGRPLYFSLFLSLENGLGATDYLRLNWNEQIYTTAKSQIIVNLITFSNNLQVASTTCTDDLLGATILHAKFGYSMQAKTWYQIQVYPSPTKVLTAPTTFLVQVLAVSDYNTNYITYDSNMAFGYVNILTPLASTGTLNIIGNSSSSQKYVPSSIYSYDIYVTPTLTSSNGGNFTLYIYYDSSDGAHGGGTSVSDFTFMGLCQSAATNLAAAAVLNFCSISSDLSTITFSVSSFTAGTAIRISTSIANPAYFSVRGIKGYWTQFISGVVYQNGKMNTALQVNKINVLTTTNRIKLFWGIDATYTDSTFTTPLPIFRAFSGTPNILQYNSFDIGFSFTSTSPINGRYIVKITINAKGVLESSIAHNLPAYSGTTVYCYYTSPDITCKNVGAFINTNYRYFISAKAFFDSSTAASITFGAVAITPVVVDNSGNTVAGTLLYDPLLGQTILTQVSQEFLDSTGYHNTGLFKIGNTQIVSFNDDLTLSSTANAMKGFLTGTNSTVGIVPDLGTSQQLLFLLNTPGASISTGGSSSYSIQLMFNSYVLSFETSGQTRGLDFVGYGTTNSEWSITTSPCYYSSVVCEKYNNDTPTKNIKTYVNTGATLNYYGMYNFQCGLAYTTPSATGCISGNCATECNMFTGYSLTDKGSSIMAMRQVVFPAGYHTPIYVDNNLLDFLLIFSQGGSVTSYCLINGYTVTGAKMQNIKAAYVNYFDNSVTAAYNKGSRIPMMVRIAGGVLPSESLSATVIGVYFDDTVDATTFYTTKDSAWALGCSTGTCNYFPNSQLSNTKMESWLTSRSVYVYNLPPIQNQFNILIPVAPVKNNRNPPKILTIAFFSQNYTVGGVTGLLQTLSVYRLFGPIVTGSVSGSYGTINSLARNSGSTPNIQLSASNFYTVTSFDFGLNTTNMYANPRNNTFTYGNGDTTADAFYGTMFGAGYTITSYYYNIFASSTLGWNQPPANTATTCTVFGYVYNEIQNTLYNAYKDKKWHYAAFCPIDSYLNLNSAVSNINFLNPQYPTYLTYNYFLNSILTYGFSDPSGVLKAYRRQTNGIPSSVVRNCTTAKLQPYNPGNSGSISGRQRATFTLTIPAITMSSNGYEGYSDFQIYFDIPPTTVSGSGFTVLGTVDVFPSTVTATIRTSSSTQVVVKIAYTGSTPITITYLQINLYATATQNFATAAAYTVTIYLPQYSLVSTPGLGVYDYVPFGTGTSGTRTTYCQCTSSFTVGITPYGSVMALNTFNANNYMKSTRSRLSFIFGASSYREAFFSSSKFTFNFGFLTNPNAATYYSPRNNFRCMVYEGSNSSSLTLSNSWKTLSLSGFNAVTLTPKGEISNPSAITYNMVCYGGAVPDGTNNSAITGSWVDTPDNLQTASTGITYNAALYSTKGATTATITQDKKRFSTSGFKSLYTLKISCSIALTATAVFYFDFPIVLNSYLDNEGVVECYLRTAANSNVNDPSQYTYCSFTNPWQLMVWNNQALAQNTFLYVDIFNIDQPANTDLSGNTKIGLSVDGDGDFTNGIDAYAEIADAQPPTNAAGDIVILSCSTDNPYILSTQNLIMTLDTKILTIFNSGKDIYLLFPYSYSQWISRRDTIPITDTVGNMYCEFKLTAGGSNLATACTFISQRILKISVSATSNQRYFTLTLKNLQTPAAVPSGKFNQYRFKVFASDASESTITYYSFTDNSQHLSLTTNPNLIALSWNYYSLSISDGLMSYSPISNQVITIQKGYYSKVIQLRQSIYPNNFKTSMTLALSNFAAGQFAFLGGALNVGLGKQLAYFRMAGDSVSPGLYTLKFSKTGDNSNIYTNIPPLTLVVQNNKCTLTTNALAYTIPIGGWTLPIVINAINCLPINPVTFSLTYSTAGGQFTLDADKSTTSLTSASLDGQIYIVIKHTQAALVAGNTVIVTITPSDLTYFAVLPTISLTLVDATTYLTHPTATALTAPIVKANTATFQLQCNQASLIYWGLGIYPSILNYQATDFEGRITSGSTGLLTNFTQTNDYFGKVYGIRQGTTMQVITKQVFQLQSNVNYLFRYYCVNQMRMISDSQSINFTSSNYGAYLMKVEATFRGAITYGQYNDIACSMAQNFILPYTRILTEASSFCGSNTHIFYANDADFILNQPDSNGWYIYGFYIEPDFTLASDSTNTNIRNQLSISTSATTIITSTTNYINLPGLVQMQTYDIQVYTTPIMSISTPVAGLQSIVLTASITNMNGFLIVGVYGQTFDSVNMSVPTTTLIKQGKFTTADNLVAVKMIHTTQNYNTTFSFTGLTSNTLYTLFYFCTVEDPSIISLSSSVMYTKVQTLQVLTIDINWESGLALIAVSLLVFLL